MLGGGLGPGLGLERTELSPAGSCPQALQVLPECCPWRCCGEGLGGHLRPVKPPAARQGTRCDAGEGSRAAGCSLGCSSHLAADKQAALVSLLQLLDAIIRAWPGRRDLLSAA